MTTFPIDHWQERAVEVSQRYNPGTGRSRMANNAFADLAPEFAELVQVVARGRCYADDTLDARTRALLTVACLVGMGEPRYQNGRVLALRAGELIGVSVDPLGSLLNGRHGLWFRAELMDVGIFLGR